MVCRRLPARYIAGLSLAADTLWLVCRWLPTSYGWSVAGYRQVMAGLSPATDTLCLVCGRLPARNSLSVAGYRHVILVYRRLPTRYAGLWPADGLSPAADT